MICKCDNTNKLFFFIVNRYLIAEKNSTFFSESVLKQHRQHAIMSKIGKDSPVSAVNVRSLAFCHRQL